MERSAVEAADELITMEQVHESPVIQATKSEAGKQGIDESEYDRAVMELLVKRYQQLQELIDDLKETIAEYAETEAEEVIEGFRNQNEEMLSLLTAYPSDVDYDNLPSAVKEDFNRTHVQDNKHEDLEEQGDVLGTEGEDENDDIVRALKHCASHISDDTLLRFSNDPETDKQKPWNRLTTWRPEVNHLGYVCCGYNIRPLTLSREEENCFRIVLDGCKWLKVLVQFVR